MKSIKQVFKVFQSKDVFFQENDKKQSRRLILSQILTVCLLAFIYGLLMGSYNGFLQAVVAGLKLVVLFISTIIICFPSLFIIQQVIGSKLNLNQMLVIILSGFVLTAIITLSFGPIVIFFLITGGNYHFIQLLHVAIFIFAGVFGMKLMIDALKYACEKVNVYPQLGVTVFRVWIIILAFVGIQLSWNLRPFLGDKNEEFNLFRKYEGNFYTAIIYSVQQLASGNKEKEEDKLGIENTSEIKDKENTDTIDILHLIEN
ncbi:MAG: hypothetical protein JXB49_03810 [Bacteroidales bacterium]|nr:hypothetical protein [Bacteroidales bacterium]